MAWQPTQITAAVRTLATSAGTAEVETDASRAYFKPLSNPEGEHALVSEWIGTRLAAWLGLPTFEIAQVEYDGAAQVLNRNKKPYPPGVGFVARAEKGFTFADDETLLNRIEDPEVPCLLIVLDTWIRNRDRYSPDGKANYGNLFFSKDGAAKRRYRLIAMDHTHCFADQCEFTPRLRDDRFVRDEGIYGLFPEFKRFIQRHLLDRACKRLKQMNVAIATAIVNEVPRQWSLDAESKRALVDFIVGRAHFLADHLIGFLELACPQQLSSDMMDGEKNE